jgi:hypothetical protein
MQKMTEKFRQEPIYINDLYLYCIYMYGYIGGVYIGARVPIPPLYAEKQKSRKVSPLAWAGAA